MEPYLYNVVNKNHLSEMLESFNECMNIPIQVLDEDGRILMSCGKTTGFCSLFEKKLPPDDSCA